MESNGKKDSDLLPESPSPNTTNWIPWVIAGAVVILGLAALVFFTGRRSTRPQVEGSTLSPADAYAASLPITDLQMSEASNFAGGKVTYIDGNISNTGSKTISGATVQVVFRNELGEVSQKETTALNLIRTREPYVDTQPLSASPLKPGDKREFRLIFDHVTLDWNQQYPELTIIDITSK
jgi:hypothetical protein